MTPRQYAVSPVESFLECPVCSGSGEVAVRDLTRGWSVDDAVCPRCHGERFVLVDDERGAA